MKRKLIAIIIIYFLLVIFLTMNIEYRNEKIWQLEVQIEDLKEQIFMLEKEKKW